MSIAAELVGERRLFPDDPLEFFERHMRPRGRQTNWSWAGREYLKDIIASPAREKVVIKGAQVAMSTTAIGLDLLHSSRGLNVAHYLPDRARMQVFVQKRVDRLINADPALAAAVSAVDADPDDPVARRLSAKGADNQRLKAVGRGTVLYQGLQSLMDAKSDDLDFLVLDEFDELDQELSDWLEDRLMASEYKLRLQLSQPSVPDVGVSELYELSDQRTWQHRCPRCRSWHVLEDEWPANLYTRSPGCRSRSHGAHAAGGWHPYGQQCRACRSAADDELEVRLACLQCGAALRETEAEVRTEWVAAHPGRALAGWRVSQVYGPALSVRYLLDRWRKAQRKSRLLRNFTISVLGQPHAGDRQPVHAGVIQAAAGDWLLGLPAYLARLPEDARPTILGGADIGDRVIYALIAVQWADRVAVVEVRALEDERRLDGSTRTAWDQLREFFSVCDYFVVDGQPERSEARRTLRTEGLTGAMCFFPAGTTELRAGMAEEAVDSDLRVVKQDRTTAIDDMADSLRHGLLRLPSLKCEVMAEITRHCARLVKNPHQTTGILEYAKHVENHWGLALTYLDLAVQTAPLFGLGPREPMGDAAQWVVRGSRLPRGLRVTR